MAVPAARGNEAADCMVRALAYFTLGPKFTFVSHSLYISWFQTGYSDSISHPTRNRKHLKSHEKNALVPKINFLRIQKFETVWTGAHIPRGFLLLNQPCNVLKRAQVTLRETHRKATMKEQCVALLSISEVSHEPLTITFRSHVMEALQHVCPRRAQPQA